MQNAKNIETLREREREREHNLEKLSFFCNAKKVVDVIQRKIIHMCINKPDYLKALGVFEFLMLKDSLFFG